MASMDTFGMIVIAIRPDLLTDADGFQRAVASYADSVRGARPVAGGGDVAKSELIELFSAGVLTVVSMCSSCGNASESLGPIIRKLDAAGAAIDWLWEVAGLGVVRGELDRSAIDAFPREHGLPGFAPTQGHIASAVPWLPHAVAAMGRGEIHRTMLLAKGSLFLGRMTQLWDGASITLEV